MPFSKSPRYNSMASAANVCFSGRRSDSPNDFIRDITRIARMNNYSQIQTLDLFFSSLAGPAKLWAKTLPDNIDFDNVMILFKDRFENKNPFATTLLKLSSLYYKEGTSLLTFMDRIIVEAREVCLDSNCLMAFFIKSIPFTLRKRLINDVGNPIVTWENLRIAAKQYDELHLNNMKKQIFNKDKGINQKRRNGIGSTKKISELVDNELENDINKLNLNYVTFVSKKLPKILCEINLKKYYALLDTGANINVINYKLLKNTKFLRIFKKASGANNNKINIIGKILNLQFKIDNKSFSDTFFVVKNLSQPLILGMPFIINNISAIINQNKTLKVNWKENKSKITEINKLEGNDFVEKTLKLYKNLFALKNNDVGCIPKYEHIINTGDCLPIKCCQYRLSKKEEDFIASETKNLENAGIIRKSKSPWRFPVIAVNINSTKPRMVIDYRKLNSITKKDSLLLPRIDTILSRCRESKIYSKLDAKGGFHHIKVSEQDIQKTAFYSPLGSYEFTRMPFGLCNAPATFQRVMNEIFNDDLGKFVEVFIDDIIIRSNNEKEHYDHLLKVYKKLKAYNIKLNENKCEFFVQKIKILGHIINNGKVEIDPERIKSIKKIEAPITFKQLHSFLGLTNFCRKFIPNLSGIAQPLYKALQSKNANIRSKFICTKEMKEAFEKIKTAISSAKSLLLPDINKPFYLTTDASNNSIGAILSQIDSDNVEKPIEYFSKILSEVEKKYSATDKELLGIAKSIEHFRPYLYGTKFYLRTDHKPLIYLFSTKNLSARLMRYSLLLQQYDFDIEYLKGSQNYSDQLSRILQKHRENRLEENFTINTIENEKYKVYKNRKIKCIDSSKGLKLIKKIHILTGHGGRDTIKYHLLQKYWWPKANIVINDFVRKCYVCQLYNKEKSKKIVVANTSTSKNCLWEIDLIGPLRDNGKNKYILTCIDTYTRFGNAKILSKKTPANVIKFLERLFILHGKPEAILSDNGKEFYNKEIKYFTKRHNIKWHFSSPYHPQTTGAVERFNRSLVEKLRKIAAHDLLNWPNYLKSALLAYNHSLSRPIGLTPYEFQYKNYFDILENKKIDKVTNEDCKLINEKIKLYRQSYHKNNITKEFKIGEKVLFVNHKENPQKFESYWSEGTIIYLKNFTCIVEDQEKTRIRLHLSDIKKLEK